MFGFLKSLFSGFGMPKPAGPARLIDRIEAGADLVSEQASWQDGTLQVNCSAQETIRLAELPLDNLEKCLLGLRFQMSSRDCEAGVYPEMWVTVAGFGEAFSKGLNSVLKGTNGWTTCELPFYLKAGQRATRLKFNVVFKGPGTVSLQRIELYATPLE